LIDRTASPQDVGGAVHPPTVQPELATMNTSTPTMCTVGYEIRFRSLFNEGRALAFPCDAEGHVPMDALSDRALNNYLYARAVVGREFARPEIRHAG